MQRFIPIAEENGLIHDLFAGVLRHACEAAVQWPEEVTLALDVYPGQMKDRSLREAIVQVLDATGMPPFRLELEITESALVSNLDSAREVVGSLRDAGVRIVLDNFGTGYSSLYHLRNFRLDKIKIDRSFVDDLESVEKRADCECAGRAGAWAGADDRGGWGAGIRPAEVTACERV